ncbi:hypothetical protein H6P81_012360 [Aristolochia fimbriata]|uniref:BHLH domain-containing protein n=1 Tax=Aristolochia fimbriata TaxID=158543 RepID=A0AAV7EF94_ARIFI|nr:hypothetical protein H6P81_012360 [Aristolochia fimbriata]
MALSFVSDYGSSSSSTTYNFDHQMMNGGFGAVVNGEEDCSTLCFCDSCVNLNTLLDGFNYQAEDPNNYLAHLLLPHELFPSQEEDHHHHHRYYSFSNINSSPELLLPPHHDDYYDYSHYPKRARTCSTDDQYYNLMNYESPPEPSHYFNASLLINPPNNSLNSLVLALPEFPPPPPPPQEFQVPVPNGSSSCTSTSITTATTHATTHEQGKKPSEGGSLSAQSVAARQRRKKISEKTQELGKLIPGGHKMNTAEMFQAAFNYVKFMETQLALLQFMENTVEKDSGNIDDDSRRLGALLSSPRIQEKLYEEGKCIVPKEAVGALARDQRLRSNLSISKDLDTFIQSLG